MLRRFIGVAVRAYIEGEHTDALFEAGPGVCCRQRTAGAGAKQQASQQRAQQGRRPADASRSCSPGVCGSVCCCAGRCALAMRLSPVHWGRELLTCTAVPLPVL
jgi:hypothetical protein